MNSAQNLFTKMYENMQQNGGGQNGQGPQGGGQTSGTQQSGGQGGNDDVVDADYKEV